MRLLISSIFVDSEHTHLWRRLQPSFIRDNTVGADYAVLVNGDNVKKYTSSGVQVFAKSRKKYSHAVCIREVLSFFKEQADNYTHFLLLDSDCWPIKKDWQFTLRDMMEKKLYAAPARIENYDFFPHPCAVFMRRAALNVVDFDHKPVNNLLGKQISDVGSNMPKVIGDKPIWLPLLKTNVVAPHPVYASIYGGVFYHHCAGSRGKGFRALQYKVYDHLLARRDHRKIYKEITERLQKAPKRFMRELDGR